jgi:hypothetical protein
MGVRTPYRYWLGSSIEDSLTVDVGGETYELLAGG